MHCKKMQKSKKFSKVDQALELARNELEIRQCTEFPGVSASARPVSGACPWNLKAKCAKLCVFHDVELGQRGLEPGPNFSKMDQKRYLGQQGQHLWEIFAFLAAL